MEFDGAIHDAVIGHRDRGKLELRGLRHELVQLAASIEQRVLGVQVQVNKVSGHRDRLWASPRSAQARDWSNHGFALKTQITF